MTKTSTPLCLHFSQKPKALTTTSSGTTLTWNHFLSKLRQMGFYGRSSGFPTHTPCFFFYLWWCISWSDYAQPGPLKRTCLCFYVGEITPPQELSCACLQLAHFSSNSLPWCILPCSFFSRGGPLAIIIILLLILSHIGFKVANPNLWGSGLANYNFQLKINKQKMPIRKYVDSRMKHKKSILFYYMLYDVGHIDNVSSEVTNRQCKVRYHKYKTWVTINWSDAILLHFKRIVQMLNWGIFSPLITFK